MHKKFTFLPHVSSILTNDSTSAYGGGYKYTKATTTCGPNIKLLVCGGHFEKHSTVETHTYTDARPCIAFHNSKTYFESAVNIQRMSTDVHTGIRTRAGDVIQRYGIMESGGRKRL
jgi:hypothetical protein